MKFLLDIFLCEVIVRIKFGFAYANITFFLLEQRLIQIFVKRPKNYCTPNMSIIAKLAPFQFVTTERTLRFVYFPLKISSGKTHTNLS